MKFGIAAAAVAILLASPAAAAPQQCDGRAFAMLIDQTAQSLRTLNRESERRFHERLEVLGKQRGWNEGQKADKAAAAMDDTKLEAFNGDIEELVAQLDTLSATPANEMSCARFAELKTVQEKLIAVMGQKSGFILAQLEAEGIQAPVAPYAQAPAPAAAPAQCMAPAPIAPHEDSQAAGASKPGGTWSANLSKTPGQRRVHRRQHAPLHRRPASRHPPRRCATHPAAPDSRTASLTPSQEQPPLAPLAAPTGYTADENPGKARQRPFRDADIGIRDCHEPRFRQIRSAQRIHRRRRGRRSLSGRIAVWRRKALHTP